MATTAKRHRPPSPRLTCRRVAQRLRKSKPPEAREVAAAWLAYVGLDQQRKGGA